jgi:hypothetical protein
MAVYLHDEVYKMGLSRFIDQEFIYRVTLRNPDGATIAAMMDVYSKVCVPITINTAGYTIVFNDGEVGGAYIAFPEQRVTALNKITIPKYSALYIALTQSAKVVAYASITTQNIIPHGSAIMMPEVVIALGFQN